MNESGRMQSVGQRKTQPNPLRVNLTTKVPKTSKEWCREYREEIKANKELYKSHRKSENARIKFYRENKQSEAAKDRNRELQRLRQKKYRESLKEKVKAVNKPTTRKSEEQKREKWREQKRKERKNMSHQKRNAVNAKRRNQQKALKGNQQKAQEIVNINVSNSKTDTMQTVFAFRTAKSRQKQKLLACMNAMPNNPTLKAAAIEAAINQSSPNTKRSIQAKLEISSPKSKAKKRLALEVTESVKSVCSALRLKRNKKDLRMRRILAYAMKIKTSNYKSFAMGISKKLAKRIDSSCQDGWEDARKKRTDAMSEESRTEITQFYDTVSKDIPNIRGAIKVGGEYQGRNFLDLSLKSTYDRYAREAVNPVSYGTFVKQKPMHVLPYTSHRFRECLCEYCLNVDLLLKSVNTVCSSSGKDCNITDRYAASRLTLCPKQDGVYKKACLDRECEKCGTSKLSAHLLPILDEHHIYTPVTWWQWEMGENKRLTKVQKESVTEGLVEALESKMGMLSKHLFNAKWQYDQYKSLADNPPSDTAVMCMDYAENFTCKAQDAPQGFHWNNTQCTIHSIVASYKCQECEEIPAKTVTDSIVVVSDDLKHDYHGVQHFVGQAIKLLKEESESSLTRFIQFSDGAPTQYKNKVNFTNCSFSENDFGVKSEKHFFGSRHGKGPCDREIGVLKKSAKAAVAAGGETILSPKEFFSYCKKNLTLPKEGGLQHIHTRRRFLFVAKTEINRNNQQRMNVKPLKDTRKYHSIRAIEPFVVSARERSCFCVSCYGDSQNPCSNKDITGPWVVGNLTVNQHQNRRRQINHEIENDDMIAAAPPEADRPVPPEADRPVPPEADRPVPPEADRPVPPEADPPVPPEADRPVSPEADRPVSPEANRPVPPEADRPVPPEADRPVPPEQQSQVHDDDMIAAAPLKADLLMLPEADPPVPPEADPPVPPEADRPVSPEADRPVSPEANRPVPPEADRPVPPEADRPVPPEQQSQVHDDDMIAAAPLKADLLMLPEADPPVPPEADPPVPPEADRPVSPFSFQLADPDILATDAVSSLSNCDETELLNISGLSEILESIEESDDDMGVSPVIPVLAALPPTPRWTIGHSSDTLKNASLTIGWKVKSSIVYYKKIYWKNSRPRPLLLKGGGTSMYLKNWKHELRVPTDIFSGGTFEDMCHMKDL